MSYEHGLKCPKCGNERKFSVDAHHTITIDGNDVDHDDSLCYENDDTITCDTCNHSGQVKSFQTED